MKRLFLLLALLSTFANTGLASYRISLITCGPGEELYSTFGHSAMRVANMQTGDERVYNFGMFDFRDPGFLIKFLRGDLDYFLGIQRYEAFVEEYIHDERSVREQVLNLTEEQAYGIVAELNRRYLPENKYYKYKFLKRNCTTELRDIVTSCTDPDIPYLHTEEGETYRYYLNRYMESSPWLKMGVNLLLGSRIDRRITNMERMCLPDQLFDGLEELANGTEPLVAQTLDVYTPQDENRGGGYLPIIILLVILFSVILLCSRLVDSIFLMLPGILGCLLLFMLFYGTHMEFKDNFNVLWCNPVYILLGLAILLKMHKTTIVLGVIAIISLIATFIIWMTGVQYAEIAFIFIAAATAGIIARRVYRSIPCGQRSV